jgi:predicted RNA-binding Zn ribbon-like protein
MPDEFQLVAGHVALDFANTLDNRYDPARRLELLTTYDRFVAFARQSEILAGEGARKLSAHHSLARVIELREALHFLFLAVAENQAPPRTAMKTLNRLLAEARAAQTLVWEKDRFEWRPLKTVAPLHAIAFAAAELLTSPDRVHVRECSAGTCRWFFLDRSKNHSRRWCDMKICGNRAKAQRFHARD